VSHSSLHISGTIRDRGLVPKDYQYDMTYGESNGYVMMTSHNPKKSNSWPRFA